jgi:hypothetical protein
MSRFRLPTFCIAMTAALLVAPAHAETGPFVGLAGSWSGGGTISLGNGSKERIRCRATYAVGAEGNSLQQSLRCASDSYRFELSGNLEHQEGQVTGMWSEASRNLSGTLSGTARGHQFQLVVTSPSFSVNLSLTTQGDRQSVVVSAPPGGQLLGASISLTHGR